MQDFSRSVPRPRHSRVMKPRSAGNSPSSATIKRRATMLAQNHVLFGLPAYQSSTIQAAMLTSAMRARNSRPISWHPSSARPRGLSNMHRIPDFIPENHPGMGAVPDQSFDPLPAYGNDNMLSYPMPTPYSPSDYFSYYSEESFPLPSHQTHLPIPNSQLEPMAWDTTPTQPDQSLAPHPMTDAWTMDMFSLNSNIPPADMTCPSYVSVPSSGELTGPSTPDFLPIQQFENNEPRPVTESKTPEEELVGMGLYSQPDMRLSSALQASPGKGLKLEETFIPTDDQDDGSQSSDGEMNGQDPVVPQQLFPSADATPTPRQTGLPAARQSSKQALNLLHKSFFFESDDSDQQTMPATQPFASLNPPCMTYGYGWI
ncbi:hypothetical protein N7474_000863 [Penicillium riverlandense]|uniref:uncharacterized protein n=1 Tax=Penicillium riverlandense TaxID=1903569 RepID=UPI00254804F1|nr:uncharacterized protein N7474_000863 [Penicillium riverlandense]KAJ5832552.1 hypothetical protein N7474_000863 [Penicillium riverlandense]